MKYQVYPAYKESGVEWLGEVPEHWEVKRLKYLVKEPLKYGANESGELQDKHCPRFIRITDIKPDGNLKDETFRSLPYEIAKDYKLNEGDLLLTRSGATVGKSFIYKESWGDCCFAGYLIKVSINLKLADADYIYLVTHSKYYWDWINSNLIQATIQNVSAEKYNNLFIAIPSKKEQQKIATFLDKETTQIDTLIEKQQKLIELLKEKRQALISHAVTKGLNPNVPF
jgi:type I restriction enzyme S subunit